MHPRLVVEAAEAGFRRADAVRADAVAVKWYHRCAAEEGRRAKRAIPLRLDWARREYRLAVVLLELVDAGHPLQRAVASRDQVQFVADEAVVFLIVERLDRIDGEADEGRKRLD